MHKYDHNIKPEYLQVVMKVQHYINQNLSGDLSLETLAGIANYSPFHFQKIFADAVLETPKQYVIRLRLDRSAHFIKLFPDLAINEIAVGCGFSSISIFSRAFRNYFGISAHNFRKLPGNDIQQIKKNRSNLAPGQEESWISPVSDIQEKIETVKISSSPEVCQMYSSLIACFQTTLSHRENIPFAFKSIIQWASPQNLITPSTKYFGIWLDIPYLTSPDKCRYLCGIEISSGTKPSKGIVIMTFEKGLYINHKMVGTMSETINSLIALNHSYIDSLGYTISEMICFEHFEESPAKQPYEKICRSLYVPIKVK
jgi:AraC family transcriptional regulator